MESLRQETHYSEKTTEAGSAPAHSSVAVQVSLPQLVLKDLFGRHLGLTLLTAAIVASACSIVYITFLVREATAKLQVLESRQHALQTEWRKLRLEQSTLGEHSRIESIAREQLGMHYLVVSKERELKQ